MPLIAAGTSHALALRNDRTAWAWGEGNWGQLGDGTWTTRTTPVAVQGLADVVSVAAGDRHSLTLLMDGTVWAWGYGPSGALGGPVPGLADVVAIAAGDGFSLALLFDASGCVANP